MFHAIGKASDFLGRVSARPVVLSRRDAGSLARRCCEGCPCWRASRSPLLARRVLGIRPKPPTLNFFVTARILPVRSRKRRVRAARPQDLCILLSVDVALPFPSQGHLAVDLRLRCQPRFPVALLPLMGPRRVAARGAGRRRGQRVWYNPSAGKPTHRRGGSVPGSGGILPQGVCCEPARPGVQGNATGQP